jgi:hypothetical protein
MVEIDEKELERLKKLEEEANKPFSQKLKEKFLKTKVGGKLGAWYAVLSATYQTAKAKYDKHMRPQVKMIADDIRAWWKARKAKNAKWREEKWSPFVVRRKALFKQWAREQNDKITKKYTIDVLKSKIGTLQVENNALRQELREAKESFSTGAKNV